MERDPAALAGGTVSPGRAVRPSTPSGQATLGPGCVEFLDTSARDYPRDSSDSCALPCVLAVVSRAVPGVVRHNMTHAVADIRARVAHASLKIIVFSLGISARAPGHTACNGPRVACGGHRGRSRGVARRLRPRRVDRGHPACSQDASTIQQRTEVVPRFFAAQRASNALDQGFSIPRISAQNIASPSRSCSSVFPCARAHSSASASGSPFWG